jgi:formamidopyrimidine-DNA glycosylase
MPELPEVETTLRGIAPHVLHQTIHSVIIRHPTLRWPIPNSLPVLLPGQHIQTASRRGKYLLLAVQTGTIIIHLGMSGRLSLLKKNSSPKKHDHVDIVFENGDILRLTDPRRFGAVLFSSSPFAHPLLKNLGPEPLTADFNADYLFKKSRQKKVPVKTFIMNSQVVVGVGNIYAAESLFSAKLHPLQAAGEVSLIQYQLLVKSIKKVLNASIKQGGTTLKDFLDSEGNKGYFILKLKVYGREGEPCVTCFNPIASLRINNRASAYCLHCQSACSIK